METSSYLFMSKRKRYNLRYNTTKMETHSSSESNISMDSLENVFTKEGKQRAPPSEDNVETILVPFYENDVLIKIPKDQKKKQNQEHNNKLRKESQTSNSYLIKKDAKKVKRTTYLEMFRKQFAPANIEKKKDEREIRSISPEFGDTERESIGDDESNHVTEYYNTEAYNEMFYDKILNQDNTMENFLENSFEKSLRFMEELRSKSPDDSAENNLKSISEVSQPRRQRRATVQPIQNVKLGGLGPDMEKIKPRLERARSLQRYSEKVRMENRLKIYKKSVQADIEKKAERETSAKRRESVKETLKDEHNTSYLLNRLEQDRTTKSAKKIYLKSKSADVQRIRDRTKDKELSKDERSKKHVYAKETPQQDQRDKKKPTQPQATYYKVEKDRKVPDTDTDSRYHSVRSSARNRGINTDRESHGKEILPMQIWFSVDVGGLRPSSALKSLEEKHKMYQEQVKNFAMDNNK